MKTPDEINMNAENAFLLREAAKAHSDGYSDHLVHGGKGDPAEERWIEALLAGADALAYIQQLESANDELLTRCERLERERDAAVEDIRQGSRCAVCRKFFKNGGDCSGGVYCISLRFEWRGVKEE